MQSKCADSLRFSHVCKLHISSTNKPPQAEETCLQTMFWHLTSETGLKDEVGIFFFFFLNILTGFKDNSRDTLYKHWGLLCVPADRPCVLLLEPYLSHFFLSFSVLNVCKIPEAERSLSIGVTFVCLFIYLIVLCVSADTCCPVIRWKRVNASSSAAVTRGLWLSSVMRKFWLCPAVYFSNIYFDW